MKGLHMTWLQEKTKSVRKTFTVPKYVSENLEKYATAHNKKQSQIVSVALEEYLHKKIKNDNVQNKLNALHNLIGIASNGSLEDIDIKSTQKQRVKKHVK